MSNRKPPLDEQQGNEAGARVRNQNVNQNQKQELQRLVAEVRAAFGHDQKKTPDSEAALKGLEAYVNDLSEDNDQTTA
jgi:hypothetical protein